VDDPIGETWAFCDGGVVKRNPSPVAGTWACCVVDRAGTHLVEHSGYIVPGNSPLEGHPRTTRALVSNNDSEFYAALMALEAAPDNWAGRLCTDSQVTANRIVRVRRGGGIDPIPYEWEQRAWRAMRRLGIFRIVQLGGHPTKEDLQRGYRIASDGRKLQVSRHQVWADEECTRLARGVEAALGLGLQDAEQGAQAQA
jgi:ribonuclease HI